MLLRLRTSKAPFKLPITAAAARIGVKDPARQILRAGGIVCPYGVLFTVSYPAGSLLAYSTANVSNGYSYSQSTVPVLFSVINCRTAEDVYPVVRLSQPNTSVTVGQHSCECDIQELAVLLQDLRLSLSRGSQTGPPCQLPMAFLCGCLQGRCHAEFRRTVSS